jgi:23S rRNA pseudouridine1911/1915/1917 synthase
MVKNLPINSSCLKYQLREGDEIHILRVLLKLRLGCSTRLLRRIRESGSPVLLNGEPVRLNQKGKPGDDLVVHLPAESSQFEPEDIPLEILYEDDHLLILNKQAGLVVHPTKGHTGNTIANGVMRHFLDSGQTGKIRFINRLDMDTSGVLLIGKNAYCQEDFARQAAAGKVRKLYLAITRGCPPSEEGVLDMAIGQPDPGSVLRQVTADGHPSRTAYRILKRLAENCCLLELELFTGRTHQIRVHLAHIACPVLGDSLYGRPEPEWIERQALHAVSLEFAHPISRERLTLTAPLPEDMVRLIDGSKIEGDQE